MNGDFLAYERLFTQPAHGQFVDFSACLIKNIINSVLNPGMIIRNRILIKIQAGFADELHNVSGSQAGCPAAEPGAAEG